MADIPPIPPISPINPLDPTLDIQRGHDGGGKKRPPRVDQPSDRPAPIQQRRPVRSSLMESLDRVGQRGDEQGDRRRQQQPPDHEADEAESTSKGHVIDFEA
jgi:hypothetical protein